MSCDGNDPQRTLIIRQKRPGTSETATDNRRVAYALVQLFPRSGPEDGLVGSAQGREHLRFSQFSAHNVPPTVWATVSQ
jgi:hypothetical protein